MDWFDSIWTETFQNIPEKLKKVEISATTTNNLRVETTFRRLKTTSSRRIKVKEASPGFL